MKSNNVRPEKPDVPLEAFAPLEWRTEELDRLRLRVRELMAEGRPRSVASQAAFGELVARRAVARAQADAPETPIDVSGPPPPLEPAA